MGVYVKAHTRAGHKVKAYVRGSGGSGKKVATVVKNKLLASGGKKEGRFTAMQRRASSKVGQVRRSGKNWGAREFLKGRKNITQGYEMYGKHAKYVALRDALAGASQRLPRETVLSKSYGKR